MDLRSILLSNGFKAVALTLHLGITTLRHGSVTPSLQQRLHLHHHCNVVAPLTQPLGYGSDAFADVIPTLWAQVSVSQFMRGNY
ncbi:hypothetical protein KIN20_028306 [Parelaphostrongylus tenuis]|uniref:Uncharacterized protein n=1 Tax=Parelaphostrongylus tenuis TaxID=148309 RepID=A0AAD5R0W0_PARTN|nr:hypothetical protein KIN20_028306 [Parelaphostrongylus tenuis]